MTWQHERSQRGRVCNKATVEVRMRAMIELARRQVSVLNGIERAGQVEDPLAAINRLTRDQVSKLRATIDNRKETRTQYAFASPEK